MKPARISVVGRSFLRGVLGIDLGDLCVQALIIGIDADGCLVRFVLLVTGGDRDYRVVRTVDDRGDDPWMSQDEFGNGQ